MAKPNTKVEEQNDGPSAEELAARTYMADAAAWDKAPGEEYGGKADILLIQVGDIAGPFIYVGHQDMTTDLGETTVHLATIKSGDTVRLPIQATFLRAIDQAGVSRGDTFLIKRFEDQIKKKGAGAGNPMAIYGVKVTKRMPKPSPKSGGEPF
jgi:hypothetical protein